MTLACAEAFCTGTGRYPSPSPPVVAGTTGLFEPQSPFPGNGILRAEIKAPKQRLDSDSPSTETKRAMRQPALSGLAGPWSQVPRLCFLVNLVGGDDGARAAPTEYKQRSLLSSVPFRAQLSNDPSDLKRRSLSGRAPSNASVVQLVAGAAVCRQRRVLGARGHQPRAYDVPPWGQVSSGRLMTIGVEVLRTTSILPRSRPLFLAQHSAAKRKPLAPAP